MGISQLEFREIAVQVLLGAVLIHPLNPPLEDAEIALGGVGVGIATAVFADLVAHYAVSRKVLTQVDVLARLIRVDSRLLGDIRLENRRQVLGLEAVHHHRTGAASLAVDQRQHLVLMGIAAPLFLSLGLDIAVVADKRLVNLNRLPLAPHRRLHAQRRHGFTDTVGHEPRSLVGDLQDAMKLVTADPLLTGAKQIASLEPLVERDVAGLEHRTDLDGELLAALVALADADSGRPALELADPLDATAMRADRTVRPHDALKLRVGSFLITKVGGVQNGHGRLHRLWI